MINKDVFNISKEYNGIVYLYNNDDKNNQYWFYINFNLNNRPVKRDFFGSIHYIREVSCLIGDFLRSRGIKHEFNTTRFNHDFEIQDKRVAYGIISANKEPYEIEQDLIIDLMCEPRPEWTKNIPDFTIVSIRKMEIYPNPNARNSMSSWEIENGANVKDLDEQCISIHLIKEFF